MTDLCYNNLAKRKRHVHRANCDDSLAIRFRLAGMGIAHK